MGVVISVANHKGGVGKTTTTVNLGAALGRLGMKVLLVDADPQANATRALGLKKPEKSLYQVLAFQDDIRTAIHGGDAFDLIPSSVHLAGFEKNNDVGKEFILQEAFADIKDHYDFILIDCPPSLGALTISALTASDYAVIPLQSEFLALQGMTDFIKILRTVKTRMNKELDLLGIVVTQFDHRKVLHRDIYEHALQTYGDAMFGTMIRGNVALAESQSVGQHIFEYDHTCNGATDYLDLANEILKRLNISVPVSS
ncbi:MAG: ParA family protein [Bacteroidia bacterium]|nr:ParA family protein [Bacteroidia bacterium]